MTTAYVFMAVHYPHPEHRARLIESMRGMAEHMAGRPRLR
jgi:hypothetical protein